MHILKKILTSHLIRLLLAIVTALLSYQIIPITFKEFFLSLSLTLKEILMFMIPFIIFSSVYNAFSKIRGRAIMFIFLLLITVIISNFISVSIAGISGYITIKNIPSNMSDLKEIDGLMPLWNFYIPKPFSNNLVLIFSLILACVDIKIIEQKTHKFARFISKISEFFLKKFFTPLLPIFIFGFLIKLLHDDIIMDILLVNPKAFLIMFVVLLAYLSFLLITNKIFYRKSLTVILRNIASPAITAFSTMSSAAALPFSIQAAENNTKNKNISDLVMPATVNVQMIGDSICIPFLAMILLTAFNFPLPTLESYLIFTVSFVITKFSGAGVPGGSILIMIPVLESCLNFTPEMSALITICYILLDPICTCGNVVGNNLFVIHFTKLYELILRKFSKSN